MSSATRTGTAEAEFANAASLNRERLEFHDGRFGGRAYDWLIDRGRASHWFLLGEEHGIAENPKLAGQLFRDLAPSGYERLAVEISGPMAGELDVALQQGGLAGLRRLFAEEGSRVAFFPLREEAELLAAGREVAPPGPFLWGLDYEVQADRHLIAMLRSMAKPTLAVEALTELEAASLDAWAEFARTRNPANIFSFCGDPRIVRAVREAWRDPNPGAAEILETLEETLEINRLWVGGKTRESNERRSSFLRANLLARWKAEQATGSRRRVFMKMGASHLVRGVTWVGTYDLGSLVPEIAACEGKAVVQVLVLAGSASETTNFDPVSFTYRPGHRDQYQSGLEPFTRSAWDDAFTLFPTAPLQDVATRYRHDLHTDLIRAVHGFDAVLVMSGSTPSTPL